MAGDWIKFEICTHDKSEVWAIAAMLKIDADAVVGKLLRVWAWFDQHTPEGNATTVTSSVTKTLLDRLVGVSGFCEAMVEVGWMIDDGTSISLPKFARHNGKTAKSRVLTAKRVAEHKRKGNAANVTLALPKEEKRREENTNKKTDSESRNLIPFSSQDFSDAWQLWHRHRLNVHKPIGDIESDAQLMELAKHPESEAIAILNYSVQVGARNLILTGDHHKKPAEKAKTNANGKRLIP
jgi:hypothetical protein